MLYLSDKEKIYVNKLKLDENYKDFTETIDKHGNTLLMKIVSTHHLSNNTKCEIINYLADKTDINLQNKNGKTALMYSLRYITNTNTNVTNLLLMNGAKTCLNDINNNNFLMLFLKIIDHNCKNQMSLLQNILYRMIYIENGNINQKNSENMSALDIAILYGSNIDTIKMLLLYGANINSSDINLIEKLYKKCFSNFDMFNTLVSLGFDIKRKTKSGLNILMLLFTTETPEKHIFINVMIDNGIDINEKDDRANTVIFHAIHHKTDFLTLIQYDIDLTVVNNRGFNLVDFLSIYKGKQFTDKLIVLIPELSKLTPTNNIFNK